MRPRIFVPIHREGWPFIAIFVAVAIALLEYTIITVFVIWAFIAVFIVHQSGTIHPTAQWLTFRGTGAGVFGASMIIAVGGGVIVMIGPHVGIMVGIGNTIVVMFASLASQGSRDGVVE